MAIAEVTASSKQVLFVLLIDFVFRLTNKNVTLLNTNNNKAKGIIYRNQQIHD